MCLCMQLECLSAAYQPKLEEQDVGGICDLCMELVHPYLK